MKNNFNPSFNQLQMTSFVSTSYFLRSVWYSQQYSSFFSDQNQFENYQNYPQPSALQKPKEDYKEKYQYLFQIHQELMELKNKSIYRELMTKDEVKEQGGWLFDNITEFLEKNLKSVYIEDLSNLFIKFVDKQNDDDLKNSIKNSIKQVLKNKKNKQIQQSSDNDKQKNSIKQQQKKNKNKDKFDNMIDNIAKNLQEIIKE